MSNLPKPETAVQQTQSLDTSDYAATPSLPDAEGEALLAELWGLKDAIKKVRKGSYEQRAAIAQLQAAMLKTAARFERHRDFINWLEDNGTYPITSYDPILNLSDMRNDIYNLKQTVERLSKRLRSTDELAGKAYSTAIAGIGKIAKGGGR